MGADAEEQIMLESNGSEEKILVSIRLRPLNEKEKARNDVSDWECINHNTIIHRNPFQTPERSLYPTAYTFDRVFRGDCSTRQVYEEGAKEVALSVASGINSSVFAYGQTSSGKTYTMCGVTEYTVADIYDYMEKHKEREFLLKFSAMEIYNESVRDLLSADSTPLRLLDDPERGTIVERLKEETLGDWNHFKELLSVCEAQRQIGDTSLNETSSRSHQILRLTVESSAREFSGNSNSSILTATVNFVDLAGSERASQALSAGTRLKEGCHINRSLLTLGTVIRKLSKGRTGHIPFRDSKLTRILQSSLGGNARTAIICTISPARSHVEQSRNTLLFASCAKEVTTNAQVNVLMSDKALVKHLQRELARVEGELRSQGPTSVVSDSAALLREKDLQIEELKKEIKEVTHQREQLILLQEHLTLQQEQLTLQRDLAQSQLKDLLRIVGTDRPSVASEDDDNQYPQLRVRRNVWEPETPVTEMPACTEFQRPYLSVRSFDASQYSDGHSMSNSDDNYLQFSDVDESYHRDASTSPSFGIPIYVETDHMSQEDLCKEVRCIEVEEPVESGYLDSNLSYPEQDMPIAVVTGIENCDEVNQESKSPYQELEAPSLEDKNLSCPEQDMFIKVIAGIEDCDEVNQESKSPNQELESPSLEDKNLSCPEQDMFIKVVAGIENCDEVNQEPKSPYQESEPPSLEDKNVPCPEQDMSITVDSGIENYDEVNQESESPCQELESPSLENKEESEHTNHVSAAKSGVTMFPWVLEKGMYSCRRLKMIRSMSCKEFFTDSSPSHWFEREEKCESTLPWGFEKEYTGRPESFQRKPSLLSNRPDTVSLTRNESPTSVGSTAVDDLKVQNTETSCCCKCSNNNIPVTVTEESSEFKENQLAAAPGDEDQPAAADDDDDEVQEAEQKSSEEVGLDATVEDSESTTKWASESGKLQRDIFELWSDCNVPLVHRTYFFLQLKGHPKESIYMEVELKRLSILKESFSQGNQNAQLANSLKDLRRERQWLSKLMKKKFSELDLQTLYLHWGIGLDTKDRRLQLAHRLWTDTEDMQHITESAKIVSKLVGVARPEPAFKEMFGLYFACPRRSSSWKFY